MIVVAIISILAPFALPFYQDYTVRANITEYIVPLHDALPILSSMYAADGMPGVAAYAAQVALAPPVSKYTTGIVVTAATGVITVTLNTASIGKPVGAAPTLRFSPYLNASGAITVLAAAPVSAT